MDTRAHHYHGRDLGTGQFPKRGARLLADDGYSNRLPLFVEWNCAVAWARALHRADRFGHVDALAWVVMPDHMHWLIRLRERALPYVMRSFKSASVRVINDVREVDGPVWQRSYHDHAVRRDEDVKTLARYVIANPVRAGLSERVGDDPFWDAAWL